MSRRAEQHRPAWQHALVSLHLPWVRARVAGPSMVPTLKDGDVILGLRTTRVRPGDVVLAEFRDMPGRLVVKRAGRLHGTGWHLASDNEFTSGDSRAHGPGDVLGRVLLVWRADRQGLRRAVPQRVR